MWKLPKKEHMKGFWTVAEWRKHYVAKALILIGPSGASFILKKEDKAPKGKYRLLGIIGD